MAQSPLEIEIRKRIKLAGPMPVRQFMTLCLTHPDYGYYVTRDPFGAGGDFITSPEISQVFGELIGLWAASVWQAMGQPENVRLVELGPGRGTMLIDAMRAVQVLPAFRSAVVLHLVEVNPKLRERQQQMLGTIDVPAMWHETFDEVPEGPVIVLANEFFDALPINQAIKQFNGWYERVIEVDANDNLIFSIASEVIPLFDQLVPRAARDAPVGAIYEWRTDNVALGIGQRVSREPGAALIIDYGHLKSTAGDTLQAGGHHNFVSPLLSPGEVDLTAHVDFEAIGLAAESMGARVHGPVEQARLLRNLGIDKRAAALKAYASPEKGGEIDSACQRLLGESKTGMGKLFKALAITHPDIKTVPGFE